MYPYDFKGAMYTTVYSEEDYLLDSGATCHVTSSLEYLEDQKLERIKIVVGKNSSCFAQSSSTVNLKFYTHDEGIRLLSLRRVFLVPMLNKKVISIPLLIREGYNFVFKGCHCLIIAPDNRYMTLRASDDHLFYIIMIRKWHRKLTSPDFKID